MADEKRRPVKTKANAPSITNDLKYEIGQTRVVILPPFGQLATTRFA
jgi:hypothetical protein